MCNSLLYGSPASYIIRLQQFQNAAVRLISNTCMRFDHISPVMKDLHWLPVKYRIMFKLVVYTFKALHGRAPTYIHQLIRIKPRSNYNLRSNTRHLLLDLPNKTKKTTGDRALIFCSRADPVERPSRQVESFGQSQNFYGTIKNSLF